MHDGFKLNVWDIGGTISFYASVFSCYAVCNTLMIVIVTICRTKVYSSLLEKLLRFNRCVGKSRIIMRAIHCNFQNYNFLLLAVDLCDRLCWLQKNGGDRCRATTANGRGNEIITEFVRFAMFISYFTFLLQEKLSHVPLLVLANKQDLMNAASADEVSVPLRMITMINANEWSNSYYHETDQFQSWFEWVERPHMADIAMLGQDRWRSSRRLVRQKFVRKFIIVISNCNGILNK